LKILGVKKLSSHVRKDKYKSFGYKVNSLDRLFVIEKAVEKRNSFPFEEKSRKFAAQLFGVWWSECVL